MARLAVADGVRTIVATPHTLNGKHVNRPEAIETAAADLAGHLAAEHIELNLLWGVEAHLNIQMAALVDRGEVATINGTGKYLLLELPSHTVPPGLKEEIFQLKLHGITPIIAHPERNAWIQEHPALLYEWVGMGALSQVTAMSVTGRFGGRAREVAEMMLRQRWTHVIASDAHSPDGRPPVLAEAVARASEVLSSRKSAMAMVTTVPEAILSGAAVEPADPLPLPEKKGFFARLFGR
jgi:protein-tyrosine phosphatase